MKRAPSCCGARSSRSRSTRDMGAVVLLPSAGVLLVVCFTPPRTPPQATRPSAGSKTRRPRSGASWCQRRQSRLVKERYSGGPLNGGFPGGERGAHGLTGEGHRGVAGRGLGATPAGGGHDNVGSPPP